MTVGSVDALVVHEAGLGSAGVHVQAAPCEDATTLPAPSTAAVKKATYSPVGARVLVARREGAMVGRMALAGLQSALQILGGDAGLGKRIRAAQDVARLLAEVSDGDTGVKMVCSGPGATSLLVALMLECGEDREGTRNDILEALAALARFLDAAELCAGHPARPPPIPARA